MATSSQKFIARNRAPRVQIEDDVERYGAEKQSQLPVARGGPPSLPGRPAGAPPPAARGQSGTDRRRRTGAPASDGDLRAQRWDPAGRRPRGGRQPGTGARL